MNTQNSIRFNHLLVFLITFLLVFASSSGFAHTVNVVDDAVLDSSSADTNIGREEKLLISNLHGTEIQTLLKFDLSALPNTILGNTKVSKASMRMWIQDVKNPGTLEFYVITEDWDEDIVTFATAPKIDISPFGTVNVSLNDSQEYLLIDVTPEVQSWFDNETENHGFLIAASRSGADDFVHLVIGSKEQSSSNHPVELEVVLSEQENSESNGIVAAVPSAEQSGIQIGADNIGNPGATNRVIKYIDGADAIGGNSQIYDDGTYVGVGTTNPSTKLEITGKNEPESSIAMESPSLPSSARLAM